MILHQRHIGLLQTLGVRRGVRTDISVSGEAAMIVALAMALMPIAMFWREGIPDSSLTLASLLALLLVGATFIFVGVRSFRHARMLRESDVK